MGQASLAAEHTFHIPVMGTGFTIDTPLKVARYGIASVVSITDDNLIEQVRERLCSEHGEPYEPIAVHDEDSRARRITAYLDLLHKLIQRQIERVRAAAFEAGSEIVRYFEMLPSSPVRELYERMKATVDQDGRRSLQEKLREFVKPGPIDVNIMTKLDREHDRRGHLLPEYGSDALSALRGFMNSSVNGSVVLSAGMNRRLFAYMGEFKELLPDKCGNLRKRIVLKVADYRSALLQGKKLAKLGLHVSEFRVESGLNCGGHAFGGKGMLMGPILDEFKRQRENLASSLRTIRERAMESLGYGPTEEPAAARVTVQGGIGTVHEDRLLREHYGVDGTGWASPFLYVPSVVNIDRESLKRLKAADENDIQLSNGSPLGVPFWSMMTSTSEDVRRQRIADGKPGSKCPKGYLSLTAEFTEKPLCTATSAYQRRKLKDIADSDMSVADKKAASSATLDKVCLCRDLAVSYTRDRDIEPDFPTAVCCGPNAAYYHQETTLDGMVDHIYGRASLPMSVGRPHMLIKELGLNLENLRKDIALHKREVTASLTRSIGQCFENLQTGIQHYRELAQAIVAPHREAFIKALEVFQAELNQLNQQAPIAVAV
jgi:hypothetical protein